MGKRVRDELTEFAWIAPPSRRRPAIFLVALAAAALGWLLLHQPLIAGLGPAMILGATADHWLPTHFRLDAQGASAKTGPSVTAMDWTDVRRVLIKDNEIRLSPLESPSTLDAFRGVTLLVTRENSDLVLDFIRARTSNAPLQ